MMRQWMLAAAVGVSSALVVAPGAAPRRSPRTRRSATMERVETATGHVDQEEDSSCEALERLGRPGPTVWTEFGDLARDLGQSFEGGVVNLGQGFPDWSPPQFVLDAAVEAASDGSAPAHQYTRTAGHPALVELLATRYARHFGRPVDAMAEVAVTIGCTQALMVALLATLRAGDEVAIIEPFFDLYLGQIKLAGGRPVAVPMRATGAGEWRLDPATLERAITAETRLLIVNSPHNPTGKVFDRAELEMIAAVVRKENDRRRAAHLRSKSPSPARPLVVVADEVYKYIVHDGSMEHVHFASLEGMAEVTLTVSSAGKTFSATGWQVGWLVGPNALIRNAQLLLPYLQFCAPTPMQNALTSALRRADEPYGGAATYYEWLGAEYARKRQTLVAALVEAGIRPLASAGGYFVIADVAPLLHRVPDAYFLAPKFAGSRDSASKDWAFCKWLAMEHGVVAIPASPFFVDKGDDEDLLLAGRDDGATAPAAYVRFAFCKSDDTLLKAAHRLAQLAPASSDQP